VQPQEIATAPGPGEQEELLAEIPLFRALPATERKRLAEQFTIERYPLGRVVCRAGDPSDAFFLVFSGRARVVGATAAGSDGAETTLALLTRGAHFGEQGLLSGTPRQNTVRAASDELVVLRLAVSDFKRLLSARPELKDEFFAHVADISVRNFLKLCTAFTPLSPANIQDMLGCLTTAEYAPGEAIIRQGEIGDALYILRSGSGRVVREGDLNAPGAPPHLLGHVNPGDSFGELALLTGQPRSATVIAEEPVSVFRLDKADFERLAEETPRLRQALVTVAAGYSAAALRENAASASTDGASAVAPLLPAASVPGEAAVLEAGAANEHGRRGRAKRRTRARRRRYPVLLQLSETDCGRACLAMALRFYGKHVGINRLRDLANVGREGATLHGIAEAAEAVGSTRAPSRRVPAPDEGGPAGHRALGRVPFRGRLRGGTGARRARRSGRRPAQRVARRVCALLDGLSAAARPDAPTGRRAGGQNDPGPLSAAAAAPPAAACEIFVASLVLQIFGLATPIFTQIIVDRVLVHESVSLLNVLLLGMLFIAVFQALTVALRQYLLVHTTRRIDLAMVVSFYRHLLSLPLRFFEARRVGDLLKRLNENAKVRHLLTGRAVGVLLDALMIVVYLGLMFFYSTKLALVALAFLPLYAGLTLAMTPLLRRQYREAFERAAEAESHIVESITGIGTVKATATERRVRWKFENLMVRALNIQFAAR
jgi:ATP-binding cassette subfamily B protein